MHPVRVLGVVMLLAVVAVPADAVLCRKKNGAVFARDACKRRETVLDPATIGAVGVPGDAGADGTTQPRLRVVDGNGQTVPGTLSTSGELLLPAGDQMAGLMIRATGGLGDSAFFEAPSCQGPPLIKARNGSLYGGMLLIGTTYYYGTGPDQLRSIQSQRELVPPSRCTGPGSVYDAVTSICCTTFTAFNFGTNVATPLTLELTPPLRVEIAE
ncbi:MAG TPA: hypothetical protein VGR62_03465 [Candidatus Binatia bacterium]|jgi:hypothetical protein|nr:hypothetical protein [Candidatus Binatia bacterium]